MERMNQAFEKVKMLVGMEVDEESPQPADSDSFSFMDDFNRQCTLSTKQVSSSFRQSAFLSIDVEFVMMVPDQSSYLRTLAFASSLLYLK